MDWDQYLFKKIFAFVTYLQKEKIDPIEEHNKVSLAEMNARLTYLARLLCGCSISISTAENMGGWRGTQFLLPQNYSRGNSKANNINYYIYRVFFMYGQLHLSHYWQDSSAHSDAESYAECAAHAAEVIEYLSTEYPMFGSLYDAVLEAEKNYQQQKYPEKAFRYDWLYGKWYSIDDQEMDNLQALINPVKKKTVSDEKDASEYTEKEGKSKEHATILHVDTKAQEEYTLTHNFEKIETLDTFSGRWRDFDGSDDMDEHSEALQELDLRQLVRVDNPVHSIYKTEFIKSLGMADISADVKTYHFAYPEWDEYHKRYKPDFCQIIYDKQLQKNPASADRILKKNKKFVVQMIRNAERYLSDHYVKKRLFTGDEPDLDAVVEAYVDICTGNAPSENVYIAKRKKTKDIAILVLTDCSLSTDGYTNNRRILDIEKEAIIMAAEVWSKMNLCFQIDTFSSRTHSQCFYTTYKAFHENWNDTKDRLGDLQSSGYTRIGAALRHATYLLNNIKADTKWLLLLSDGKPNDFDTYEGNYGIFDIKKAIKEASQKNIHTSAIAIDSGAKYYLPKMFGINGFTILHHPAQLPEALTKFYINLLK